MYQNVAKTLQLLCESQHLLKAVQKQPVAAVIDKFELKPSRAAVCNRDSFDFEVLAADEAEGLTKQNF